MEQSREREIEVKLSGRVELPRERIDEIFEAASDQADYLISLYREVVPDLDKVKRLDGWWPKANTKTWQYIAEKAMKFDREHHPGVLPGGLWMNKGFSVDDTVPEWEVDLKDVVAVYPEEELGSADEVERQSQGFAPGV